MNFRYYKTGPLIIFILVLSVLGTILNNSVNEAVTSGTDLAKVLDFVGITSVIGNITIILLIIDKWAWSWQIKGTKLFGWLVKLPDLRGRYTGKLTSSFQLPDGRNKEMLAAFEITQTASKIKVFSYYYDPDTDQESSEARSILEEVVKEDNGLFKVHFIFTNEPGTFQEALNTHNGTAWLLYYPDANKLRMEYYNRKGNSGTAELTFEKKETIGRYK